MYTNTNAIERPDLEVVLTEHLGMSTAGFAGLKLMPVLNTQKQSGKFHKITFSELDKQILDNKKYSTSGYNRVERKTSKDSYDCSKYGLEEILEDDDVLRMGAIKAEAVTTSAVGFNNLRAQELRIKKLLWNTTSFSSKNQQKVAKAFTDPEAKIKHEIDMAKLKLKQNIGGTKGPGTKLVFLCSDEVILNILATRIIQEKTVYTRKIQESDPSLDELARYLQVDEIVEASSRIDGSLIFDNEFALLAIVSDSDATQLVPRIGNTWLWTKSTGSNNTVETYRDESKESDVVRVKHHTDEKIMSVDCGVLFTGITK